MVQFEPMYDTIGSRIYPEKELAIDNKLYVVRFHKDPFHCKFRGKIVDRVFNKLNGRWAYKLLIDRHWDVTKVHDETWFAFSDLISWEDKINKDIENGK